MNNGKIMPCEILLSSLGFAGVSCFLATSVAAFETFQIKGGNFHEQISQTALSPLGVAGGLAGIDRGNTNQDSLPSNLLDSSHHFDDCTFAQSKAFIELCYTRIKQKVPAALNNKAARGEMLVEFGNLLHPVQDFYSHSNHVELALSSNKNLTPSQIGLVDWANVVAAAANSAKYRTGFFRKRELISRGVAVSDLTSDNALVPGTSYLPNNQYDGLTTFDQRLTYFCDSRYSVPHCDINKDKPTTDEGQLVNPNTNVNLHQYARDLAVRETARQWKRFETEIRSAGSSDPDQLIGMLKQGI